MKKYALNDITLMQFIFMIHGAQLGIGLLSLPSELAKSAGTDGWIALLIGWALSVFFSVILILAMQKHPEDTLYDLLPRYFGKALGGMINIGMICYFAFAFFVCFITSVGLMRLEILSKTPPILVELLLLIPTYTIARNQVRVLSRYAELTFWGFLWLILVFMEPLRDAHVLNLLPVLKEGWKPVLSAVKSTFLSFLGFETAFILYPFLKHKQHAIKAVIIANTLTLVDYLIVIVVCFLFFSPDDLTSYKYPIIKLIKIVEFRFLDRVEIILLVSYLFLLSKVWMLYLFYAVFGSSQMLGKQDHRPYLRMVLTVFLLSTLFFSPSNEQVTYLLKLLGNLGSLVAFAFPLFLFVYTRIFKPVRKGDPG